MKLLHVVLYIFSFPASMISQNPVELGNVHWHRDLQKAQDESKKSNKPIFILFQEVPGCITCQKYGEQVLKHPLIVDAIESHFIPLAIHNNKGGPDKKVLNFFNEPAWNNPVARIVDHQLRSVVSRLEGGYTPIQVVNYLIRGMEACNVPVPAYLTLLKESLSAQLSTLHFSMYCFWEGEGKLGGIQGVVATTPGFMHGKEVVQVQFDADKISHKALIQEAKKLKCFDEIYSNDKSEYESTFIEQKIKAASKFRPDQDPQYYLKQTAYKYVPMLPIQASRINSAIANRKDGSEFLSPKQKRLYEYFKQHPDEGIATAYTEMNMVEMWKLVRAKIKEKFTL